MNMHPFELASDEDLIIVQGWVQGYPVRLAVDTAATHTVLDFNILLILGYNSADLGDSVPIEAANGPMEAHFFEIADFLVLGKHHERFQIMTYDYLSKGIFSQHIVIG